MNRKPPRGENLRGGFNFSGGENGVSVAIACGGQMERV
jgi:hypothetical protein